MKRRLVLTGLTTSAVATTAAGLAGLTFRWHSTPQQGQFLTDTHLQHLTTTPLPGPRVLFVGNSMTLRHDLVGQIARLAEADGVQASFAQAAANGGRLIETSRIAEFQDMLARGWDVLVLQDFSTVSLRAPDRWGSEYAMRKMARAARARSVLLYPTWAFPPKHHVYRSGGGRFSNVPANPAEFTASIVAHYQGIADQHGWVRAPITEAMAPDSAKWLESDQHHPNAAGSAHIAQVLWQSLAPLLEN